MTVKQVRFNLASMWDAGVVELCHRASPKNHHLFGQTFRGRDYQTGLCVALQQTNSDFEQHFIALFLGNIMHHCYFPFCLLTHDTEILKANKIRKFVNVLTI